MTKSIEENLALKHSVRPRIYAYSIDDAAHKGLLKVGNCRTVIKFKGDATKTVRVRYYSADATNCKQS
ncbi:MAG: hypothetical protein JXR76_02395 [Deltaproteobacteria bacterium]|nr:hypothetical protein [Deltaproteobacteria bacterium]